MYAVYQAESKHDEMSDEICRFTELLGFGRLTACRRQVIVATSSQSVKFDL